MLYLKRNYRWLAVICLASLILILASCDAFQSTSSTPVETQNLVGPAPDTTDVKHQGMEPMAATVNASIGIAWPFGGAENPNKWSGWTGSSSGGRLCQTGCGYKNTHSGADQLARDLSRSGCDGVLTYVGISGLIVEAGDRSNGYGGTVVVYDANRHIAIRYSHLSVIGVSKGQSVRWGQYIGRVGNTGNSTGAHLHIAAYENVNHFYKDGYPVIPTLCDDTYYTCGTYFYCW